MRYFVEIFIVGLLSVAFFGFSTNAQIVIGLYYSRKLILHMMQGIATSL